MKWPKTIDDEYRVKCKDCKYARSCGAAEFQARRLARMHAQRYYGHRVRITKDQLVDEYTYERQGVLPDVPPF